MVWLPIYLFYIHACKYVHTRLTHTRVYICIICVYMYVYINDTCILDYKHCSIYTIRQAVWYAMLVLRGHSYGGFLQWVSCSGLVGQFHFYIFSCGFRIYITLVSMCIALWLGCQTICSNILSMHIYAWLIYAYMHG